MQTINLIVILKDGMHLSCPKVKSIRGKNGQVIQEKFFIEEVLSYFSSIQGASKTVQKGIQWPLYRKFFIEVQVASAQWL